MLTSNTAGLSQRIVDKSSSYVGCTQKARVIGPSVRGACFRGRTGSSTIPSLTMPGRSSALMVTVLYQRRPSWWTVPLSQVPQHVRMAFVLREDQRFYQHAGVEARALLRAIVKTLTGRRQGGSTIAMQVAKHCLLDYGARPAQSLAHGSDPQSPRNTARLATRQSRRA